MTRHPAHQPGGRDDRGSITIISMILLVLVFAGAGLIVDGGRAMSARRHASNIAEGAARAAVATATPMQQIDPGRATSAALDHAQRSGIDPHDVTVSVVDDVVRVTIVERRSTVFLILGGQETLTVHATGTARRAYIE